MITQHIISRHHTRYTCSNMYILKFKFKFKFKHNTTNLPMNQRKEQLNAGTDKRQRIYTNKLKSKHGQADTAPHRTTPHHTTPLVPVPSAPLPRTFHEYLTSTFHEYLSCSLPNIWMCRGDSSGQLERTLTQVPQIWRVLKGSIPGIKIQDPMSKIAN
jgi:hypothetical protein